MSKNVKIGNNTLTGVTTIKLEDANTSGTYDSFVDTTDANATSGDIANGKTAYVNGVKVTGTSSGGADLNIHYSSATAPSDTTKLWVKTDANVGKVTVTNDISGTPNGITTLSTTLQLGTTSIGAAAVGTKIYLFGGYNNTSGCLNTIQVFDTTNNTINTLSVTLPKTTNAIGTAAVGTKIYLFGGYGGSSSGYLNTIQVFDTTNNTISTVTGASTLYYASEVCCAAVGTKIYLFGGVNTNGPNNAIQVFNTTNNTINTLSVTLPTAASNIGAAAVGTKIYLFGGYNNLNGTTYYNTIQVFDTTNNTINTLSVILSNTARGIGTAAVGTKIYLFGGYRGNYLNTIQVFDTTNNTISTLSVTLPTAEYNIGTAAVGTKIYLFGGSANGGIRLDTINRFTVIVSLPQNELALFNALGTADEISLVSSNTFDLKIQPQTAFIGNSSNQGEYVQIARYNGSSWVNIN